MRRLAIAFWAFIALAGTAPGSAAAQPAAADWPMAAFDLAHTGNNPAETSLGVANAAQLHPVWSVSVDGSAITTQAILAAGVPTATASRDLLIVSTEHGTTAALDAVTGATVWSVNTGYVHTTCGDLPNGDFGITSAAAFDRLSGAVYAMGGDGKLYAYAVATGAVLPGWPVSILGNPSVEHVYGAVTVANGSVYVATGGLCDVGVYYGRIVQVTVAPTPAVANRLYVGGTVADASGNIVTPGYAGGGVWGAAGVTVDSAGSVYAATGNLLHAPNENMLYGNHILKMLPNLSVTGATTPQQNPCGGCDNDFGSTPVLFQPATCRPRLAVLNKRHYVYVYRPTPFTNYPFQYIHENNFVGEVAYEPGSQTLISANLNGVRAYHYDTTCQASATWVVGGNSGPGGQLGQAVSPPTIANGVVYYANGAGSSINGFNLATGQRVLGRRLSGYSFAAPTVVNGALFQPTWDGKVTAFRP